MDYAVQFGRLARHIQLITARDDPKDCHPQPDIDLCEKPSSDGPGTGIVIGALAGGIALVLAVVLTYLHYRKKRMDEKEWPRNNAELDDYGFDVPQSQRMQRPPPAYPQPHNEGVTGANRNVRESRGSLDDLERSLRGHTTNAFKRHDDDVAIDIKPAVPADKI